MTLNVVDEGTNNFIEIKNSPLIQGQVVVKGNNSNIRIGKSDHPGNLNILVHSNSRVVIGDNFGFGDIRVYLMSHDCEFALGDSFLVNGSIQMTMHEPSRFSVGSDCLIAPGASFQTSDIHSIFDLKTGRRSNPSRDIVIGDHVWIGAYAVILKGASIGNGSVIGRNSVVTGVIPPCSVAGGVPARVLQSNATWHHELLGIIPSNLNELAQKWMEETPGD